MIVKTVRFGKMDCRGRLTMDEKGAIRYSNPDLLKPFKPVSGKLNLRRETVEKWKDRLVKTIRSSAGEGERCKAMAGAKCGPFTILETDGKRMLMQRGEAAPEAHDATGSGLHETPNLKAILDWPQEFELPVRRAQLAAPEEIRTMILTLTQASNDGQGNLVITAKSDEVEYEESLSLSGCVWIGPPALISDQAKVERVPKLPSELGPETLQINLNADYVHDVCGTPLNCYLQGPEEPVTWATPDDRYRYVLMPIRP